LLTAADRHQWIFITDTVDAVYRPDNWYPEAMMEQLAEIVGNLPVAVCRISTLVAEIQTLMVYQDVSTINQAHSQLYADQQALRRPHLNSTRQIESMRDLVHFFSNISISSYESMYASSGNVDWEAVEKGIVEDMFDGR